MERQDCCAAPGHRRWWHIWGQLPGWEAEVLQWPQRQLGRWIGRCESLGGLEKFRETYGISWHHNGFMLKWRCLPAIFSIIQLKPWNISYFFIFLCHLVELCRSSFRSISNRSLSSFPQKKHQKWDGLKTTKYFKITRSNLLKRKLPVASIKFLLSHTNIPFYYPVKNLQTSHILLFHTLSPTINHIMSLNYPILSQLFHHIPIFIPYYPHILSHIPSGKLT